MNKAEISQGNQEKLARAIVSLRQIADEPVVPRNIRNAIGKSLSALQDKKMELSLRVVNAVSALDKVAEESSMPSFARITMWSAVSELESIRE